MYSQAEAHLANLEGCSNRGLRRAYLVLLLAAERAGLQTEARETSRGVAIRDARGQQPFAITIDQHGLDFELRRPALDAEPGLSGRTTSHFGGRIVGGDDSQHEIRIRVASEADAEDIVDWLFPAGNFNPGYAARRSA